MKISKILDAMKKVITKHGLELLQRYPNDLLVHDKATLERAAAPGAQIAWMVGHSHTHLVVLGLHPKENENVEYLTNLANDDRFYILNIGHGDAFKMAEVGRKGFAELSRTAVPYKRQGDPSGFWLYRHKSRIGHVILKRVGAFQENRISAAITPAAGITDLDRAALEMWCSKSAVEMTHTLFVRSEVVWNEPLLLLEQAA